MQRNFQASFAETCKIFLFISKNVENYFSFTNRYFFLLQNYPFQAFLVSKTCTFIHEGNKLIFLLICPLLRHSGGGAKGLSGHVC